MVSSPVAADSPGPHPPRRPVRQNTDQVYTTRPPPLAVPSITRASTFAAGEKMDHRYVPYDVIRGELEPSDDERQARDYKTSYDTPDGGIYTGLDPPPGSTMKGTLYPRTGTLG